MTVFTIVSGQPIKHPKMTCWSAASQQQVNSSKEDIAWHMWLYMKGYKIVQYNLSSKNKKRWASGILEGN